MYNPLEPDPLVYDISNWDALQWEDYLDKHPEAERGIKVGTQKVFSFATFASEIFHRLYAPEPKAIESPKPEAQWAVQAHQQLTELPEFEDLATTIEVEAASDSFKKWHLSGVGAANFSQQIAQSLPKPRSPLTNPQPLREQILAAKRRLQQLQIEQIEQQSHLENQSLAPEQRERATEQIQQLQPQIQDLEQQIANITTEGKKAVANAVKYAQRLEAQLSDLLTMATARARMAVEDAAAALNAFGWGDGLGTAGAGISFSDKMALANRVASNQKLIRIAQSSGRLKLMAARKQRTKTTEIGTEIYSIETGNNLSRLVPTEFIKLAVPQLKPVFIKDYGEHSLLQYQLRSKEKLSKGPIVICLDSSGSMAGEKEEWSKAVAIALIAIASQQKRTCRLLHFCSQVVRVDDFPAGKLDPVKLIASMEAFYNGGTSWEAPLTSALEIIQSEAQFKKADIILITDGECSVSAQWLSEFKHKQKEREFATYGVMLGSRNTSSLGEIIDCAIAIPNLSADGAIETIFSI